MAIYKGREVIVLGRSDGADVSPMYDILDQWSQRSSVKMNELQFTDEEVKTFKGKSVNHLDNAKIISQKDLQELRDGQDREKIEKNQKTQKTSPVEVKKVMVDPSEVKAK